MLYICIQNRQERNKPSPDLRLRLIRQKMTRACMPRIRSIQQLKLTLGSSLGLHLAGLLGHLAVGIGLGGGGSEMIVLLLDALPLCLGLAFVAHGSRRRFVRVGRDGRDASGGFCICGNPETRR